MCEALYGTGAAKQRCWTFASCDNALLPRPVRCERSSFRIRLGPQGELFRVRVRCGQDTWWSKQALGEGVSLWDFARDDVRKTLNSTKESPDSTSPWPSHRSSRTCATLISDSDQSAFNLCSLAQQSSPETTTRDGGDCEEAAKRLALHNNSGTSGEQPTRFAKSCRVSNPGKTTRAKQKRLDNIGALYFLGERQRCTPQQLRAIRLASKRWAGLRARVS